MLSLDRWMAFVTHDIVKYLLAAGGAYVLVYGVLAARLASRRLQTARSDLLQIGREVGWSLVSAVIFGTASLYRRAYGLTFMIHGYDVSDAIRPVCLHNRFQAFDAAATMA